MNELIKLECVINQSKVSELKIGDYIRSEEMSIFQKVIKLEQDPYLSTCLRITLDKKNELDSLNFVERFIVNNKNNFVESRKVLSS